MHEMQTIVTDVCGVCLSCGSTRLQCGKRLNRSRSCLGWTLLGAKEISCQMGVLILPQQGGIRCSLHQITLIFCYYYTCVCIFICVKLYIQGVWWRLLLGTISISTMLISSLGNSLLVVLFPSSEHSAMSQQTCSTSCFGCCKIRLIDMVGTSYLLLSQHFLPAYLPPVLIKMLC